MIMRKVIPTRNNKSVLGGRMRVVARPKDGGSPNFERRTYDAARDIKKFGLVPVEKIKSVNPITGEEKMITIRRDGTTDSELAMVMADPTTTRELKDTVVSRYLFERGKESASMMMDLWKYKGEHTKEARHWMSNMRWDFELFMEAFMFYMNDSADRIIDGLGVGLKVVKDKNGNEKTFVEPNLAIGTQEIQVVLGDLAVYMRQTANLMRTRIDKEKEKREREKGKGIYIGLDGKPYSIYEDVDVEQAVKKDKKTL